MSAPIDDGAPAFPRPSVEMTDNERNFGQEGMSLRDWFAGKAMAAMISIVPHDMRVDCGKLSESAYVQADAMIAARKAK